MLILKKFSTRLTLILSWMLIGCVFSLLAFIVVPAEVQAKPLAGCFPSNAVWTWTDTAHKPPLQAWMGPLENDKASGWHHNLHVQQLCGGDFHNYHITYNKGNPKAYEWHVYDDVTKKTRVYTYPRGCGCTGGFPLIAAEVASVGFAGDVGNDINDHTLTQAVFQPADTAFLNVAVKSGDH